VSTAAKVLVVDDEDAGRYAKVQILRRAGFEVVEASNGTDCLALVDSERPQMVVLDVNLPDISGLEVARRLRARGSAPPTIQILQVSNTATSSADKVRGLEHGADVYLTEPIDSSVLIATARALMRVRRAEEALASALDNERSAREVAEHANRLKDEFIATLSHELRTPLNALMGWIWQLRHTKLDQQAQTRALDSLERNARMHSQLINDLLDVSRASKGKLQLEMRVVDFEDVVQSAVDAVREAIDRKQLRLDTRLERVLVAGDYSRLQQVVMNLLTNAVQFTPQDGRVSITLRAEGPDAALAVQDSGAGIEPAFLPHVFDQFRQGEGGLSRKHGGLGIGLAVVRQLMELHGGSVDVMSAGAGQGATFTVRLPRETVLEHQPANAPEPLLLDGVRVLFETVGGDANPLADFLRASGAVVETSTDSGSAEGRSFDVIVRGAAMGVGSVQVQVAGARQADDPGFKNNADLVRFIAHRTMARADQAKPL
jgi:signal transduction histidine kinase